MCAIFGAVVSATYRRRASTILNHIIRASHERGRDGRGFLTVCEGNNNISLEFRETTRAEDWRDINFFTEEWGRTVLIGNLRAEPTTEYVARKAEYDQQPYTCGQWSIVHNGTIANDKELRTHALPTSIDSAAIAEVLAASKDSSLEEAFANSIFKIKGSYAILAVHDARPNHLWVAANYRPIWYAVEDGNAFFASARQYFPSHLVPQMLRPYTTAVFEGADMEVLENLRLPLPQRRALVVCSGGLDSVVAATYVKRKLGLDTALVHFTYGSRAESKEIVATADVARALGVPLFIQPLPIYKPSDSPLLQADSKIAGGEAGAEFAHEWVPARNLVMLSVATAFAEANGFDTIALGNNLEEAGAYPDNEPEFIARFGDLLPFAVGDGKHINVIQPVGNMMKHEIVALGHKLGAPMHLTWSCYRNGPVHCGTCGPCYMRRKAFEINKLPEVIPYANEG